MPLGAFLPLRIYTDRHRAVRSGKGSLTTYGQTLKDLQIIHSIAYSPEAKGRIERANRTLQDRLVKAMRKANISTIQEANAFTPLFIQEHNLKFAKAAACAGDNHRPVAAQLLEIACAKRSIRKVTKNLTFSFHGVQYIIDLGQGDKQSIGGSVEIAEQINGKVVVYGAGTQLRFHTVN